MYSSSHLSNENIDDNQLLTSCDLSVHIAIRYNFEGVKMQHTRDSCH